MAAERALLKKSLASAGLHHDSLLYAWITVAKISPDMQIVVTRWIRYRWRFGYSTYVLVSGDRDFTPLVQSLRKRGKQVIGMGIRHTASRSFVDLCDLYVFYEDIVPAPKMTDVQVQNLLANALQELLVAEPRVRASVLKQKMSTLSNGAFDKSQYADGSFRKFLEKFPQIVEIQQVNTTIYARLPQSEIQQKKIFEQYRTSLKKRKIRIVPAEIRFRVLKDMVQHLQERTDCYWRGLIDALADQYRQESRDISKNLINATLLVARRAQIIRTLKGQSLATAPVELVLSGEKIFQEAVMRCDAVYLQEIIDLPESFDLHEAAQALYYPPKQARYLQVVMKRYHPYRD